jgi:hypothetical protein
MAPKIRIPPMMYIRAVMNMLGVSARIAPKMMLPTPTMGKVGDSPAMTFPYASVILYSDTCFLALIYTTSEMTPERKNSTPIATVIQVTVLSGYLMSKMPTAMAQMARKTELCNIFIIRNYSI